MRRFHLPDGPTAAAGNSENLCPPRDPRTTRLRKAERPPIRGVQRTRGQNQAQWDFAFELLTQANWVSASAPTFLGNSCVGPWRPQPTESIGKFRELLPQLQPWEIPRILASPAPDWWRSPSRSVSQSVHPTLIQKPLRRYGIQARQFAVPTCCPEEPVTLASVSR